MDLVTNNYKAIFYYNQYLEKKINDSDGTETEDCSHCESQFRP